MKTHKSVILWRLPGTQAVEELRALLGAFPRRTSPLFSRVPFNFRAALQLKKTLGGGQVTVAPTYDEM